MTAGSSTTTVTISFTWAASTAPAPCVVAAALDASSGNRAWSQITGWPRCSAKLGTTAGAPVRRWASSRRSRVATRTCGRSTGHATTAEGRIDSRAERAARSDPIVSPARSGFSTMTHSWEAREGRTRAASGPSTTTRDFKSSASSASRMRTAKGRPRKSKSALGLPIRSEAPAASTIPARPMLLRYRELHPAAKPPNWRPMAVRRIRQLGDPILRVRCERVQNPKSAATRLVADDLRDSLAIARKKYKMGRALAAPQIGAPVRIVFVQMDKQRWTMINPEITDVGRDDFLVWDDCFSFPNLLVRVNRAYQITVSYTDPKGKLNTMELEGPMAELLQHEIDHLDGILALDRASGVDPFAFRSEWEKVHDAGERYGPPKPREV